MDYSFGKGYNTFAPATSIYFTTNENIYFHQLLIDHIVM